MRKKNEACSNIPPSGTLALRLFPSEIVMLTFDVKYRPFHLGAKFL